MVVDMVGCGTCVVRLFVGFFDLGLVWFGLVGMLVGEGLRDGGLVGRACWL